MKSIFDIQDYNNVIACIGDNTAVLPDYRDFGISRGYNSSVRILYESIKNDKELEDILIYPIFYNARLGLEILLKAILNYQIPIERIYKCEKDICHIYKTHNIEILYNLLVEKSEYDYRIKNFFNEKKIEFEYISNFYFDSKSDSFRYTFSDGREIILKGKKRVDVSFLIEIHSKIISALEELVKLYGIVIDEYSTGSFTKNLKREQLVEIAEALPNRDEWSKKEFVTIKNSIKKEYNIGSKEFSDAVSIIERVPYLSAKIGREIIIKDFSDFFYNCFNDLKDYIEQYDNILKNSDYGVHRKIQTTIVSDEANEIRDKINRLCCSFDTEDKALFLTFANLDMDYCEHFELVYQECSSIAAIEGFVRHLSAIKNGKLHRGLINCGQDSIIRKLGLV